MKTEIFILITFLFVIFYGLQTTKNPEIEEIKTIIEDIEDDKKEENSIQINNEKTKFDLEDFLQIIIYLLLIAVVISVLILLIQLLIQSITSVETASKNRHSYMNYFRPNISIEILKNLGYKKEDTIAGGNCFFHAIANELKKKNDIKHYDYLKTFLQREDINFDDYVEEQKGPEKPYDSEKDFHLLLRFVVGHYYYDMLEKMINNPNYKENENYFIDINHPYSLLPSELSTHNTQDKNGEYQEDLRKIGTWVDSETVAKMMSQILEKPIRIFNVDGFTYNMNKEPLYTNLSNSIITILPNKYFTDDYEKDRSHYFSDRSVFDALFKLKLNMAQVENSNKYFNQKAIHHERYVALDVDQVAYDIENFLIYINEAFYNNWLQTIHKAPEDTSKLKTIKLNDQTFYIHEIEEYGKNKIKKNNDDGTTTEEEILLDLTRIKYLSSKSKGNQNPIEFDQNVFFTKDPPNIKNPTEELFREKRKWTTAKLFEKQYIKIPETDFLNLRLKDQNHYESMQRLTQQQQNHYESMQRLTQQQRLYYVERPTNSHDPEKIFIVDGKGIKIQQTNETIQSLKKKGYREYI